MRTQVFLRFPVALWSLVEPPVEPPVGMVVDMLRIRPNSDLGRPPESGRTQIWDGRPNPAELRLGTAARIRPKNIFFNCKLFKMMY